VRRHLPPLLSALVAVGAVLVGLDAPLVDDSMFWWVPKALLVAEQGPSWVLAGDLPAAALPELPLPPQWSGGLPDYGHPPFWFWYLGAWLKLLGPTHTAVHLAAVPVAALFGAGVAALLRRLGGQAAAWAAPAVVLLPPAVAQLQRADTDLPLMALSIWAVVAILDRRDLAFAGWSVLAVASKEPGVLLSAPMVAAMLLDRRWSWTWLAPPLALGVWAGIHYSQAGWALAGSERLPESAGVWLRDLGSVLWLMAADQWRWVLIPAAAFGLVRGAPRRRAYLLVAAHALTQWGFYGTLNFLGGIDRVDAYTHIRYLLPGTVAFACLWVAPLPAVGGPLLALVCLLHLHSPSPRGPEASLYGVDVARAVRAAAPTLEASLAAGEPVWAGSYAWTALTRPYAGTVEAPLEGLGMYALGTEPTDVRGLVLHAAVGEPLGRLQELELLEVREFTVHRGQARLLVVQE
jgi:hypothetical protein